MSIVGQPQPHDSAHLHVSGEALYCDDIPLPPNTLHAEQVITAANAGKHVICEKPFTATAAEAERTLVAVRATKVRHSMGYRLHFDPYHQELIRLAIEQGGLAQLGPIVEAIESTGGLEYAATFAQRETNLALAELNALPDTPYRQSLAGLARFAQDRTS